MNFLKTALFSTAISLIAVSAQADDYKVYKPEVTKGEFALESNLNYSADHRKDNNNYFSQVLGVEYGLTDYWKSELSAELEKNTHLYAY